MRVATGGRLLRWVLACWLVFISSANVLSHAHHGGAEPHRHTFLSAGKSLLPNSEYDPTERRHSHVLLFGFDVFGDLDFVPSSDSCSGDTFHSVLSALGPTENHLTPSFPPPGTGFECIADLMVPDSQIICLPSDPRSSGCRFLAVSDGARHARSGVQLI